MSKIIQRTFAPHGLRAALFVAIGIFALASSAGSRAQTLPLEGDAVWPYLAGLSKDNRMAVLKREAAREGVVVLYGVLGIDRAQIFINLFRQSHPEVKIDFVRLTSGEAAQRVMTEHRAGRVNSDIIMSSPDWLEIIKPALAPFEPTSWNDFDPRFRHGSKATGWTAMDYEILAEAIAWRTDRINRAEAPKSLDQVAEPKWKGRTGTVISRENLVDSLITLYGESVAMDKVRALGALENRHYPSIAALNAALAAGEIDVAWGIGGYRAAGLKASGAPVDYVIQDPALAISVTISATRGAKHPYAAALLMEFLTDATVLEALDKAEPGRLFGNLKGNYTESVSQYPKLLVFRPIPEARFRELNRIVERQFLRRQ
jgi:iron(III) transport system substrate-binding protein